jgi:uncharacterized protein with PQ loop repeat
MAVIPAMAFVVWSLYGIQVRPTNAHAAEA